MPQHPPPKIHSNKVLGTRPGAHREVAAHKVEHGVVERHQPGVDEALQVRLAVLQRVAEYEHAWVGRLGGRARIGVGPRLAEEQDASENRELKCEKVDVALTPTVDTCAFGTHLFCLRGRAGRCSTVAGPAARSA